ncbi:Protein ccc1 [Gnomoniopsis smithogilvyi]|uniref:Protein ccc1 n=1 Tax=Gnomoniopsis smithogilvyi TaxID=1191159 RepID=A0A9W9CZ16_9PEZI|nr:Protein ccc1 [Gnomoniopsis smithogilvyi]
MTERTPLIPNGRNGAAEPAVERNPSTNQALLRPDALRRPSMKAGSYAHHPGHHDDSDSHSESHSNNGSLIRDITIGFADGLTVPFALTAGLSSLGSTKIVVIGGLAELFSGMISMGLGAYLAAATERQHWQAEYERECWEVDHCPDREREEIYEVLEKYGISRDGARGVVEELCVPTVKGKERWVQFMMDFELCLPEPETTAAWKSAITMGLSYFIGGLVPMIPYFIMDSAQQALFASIAITVVILLVFGYVKSWVTIRTKRAGFWGALQTLLIGAAAAATSYVIVRLLDSGDSSP